MFLLNNADVAALGGASTCKRLQGCFAGLLTYCYNASLQSITTHGCTKLSDVFVFLQLHSMTRW